MSKKKRGEERMKEEDNILKKVGKKNSFKVPEGYFENLTSEVMGKLPEKEGPAFEEVKQPTMWIRMKPLLYMAAMFIGAALIIQCSPGHHLLFESLYGNSTKYGSYRNGIHRDTYGRG